MDTLLQLTHTIAANFWNSYTIGLLLGTGLLLTIVTRGIQIRMFGEAMKLVLRGALRRDSDEDRAGDITPFQALTTALSATVGNGNIAGVATAIVTGGPGAIFWMWMTAIVGMATKYSEAVLGVHFRKMMVDGSIAAGPMYYIRYGFEHIKGLKHAARPLAFLFAFCGAWTALFGTGNMMQSNSIALAFQDQFHVPFWISGTLITLLTGLVIIGGIKKIGAVAERLVPSMIILYVFGALLTILLNLSAIPGAFLAIFKGAFTSHAVIGGYIGKVVKDAIQSGVSRGLLSNESGMGSAPIAHGAAKAENAYTQGLVAMMGTFIDTLVVCTMTALCIIVTGAYQQAGLQSIDMTTYAFNQTIPYFGGWIVALGSLLFGFSTLIGWYYYGEQCLQYMLGIRIVRPFRVLYLLFTFLGALMQEADLPIVWNIGVVSNGLMAIPNLIGLIGLMGLIKMITDNRGMPAQTS